MWWPLCEQVREVSEKLHFSLHRLFLLSLYCYIFAISLLVQLVQQNKELCCWPLACSWSLQTDCWCPAERWGGCSQCFSCGRESLHSGESLSTFPCPSSLLWMEQQCIYRICWRARTAKREAVKHLYNHLKSFCSSFILGVKQDHLSYFIRAPSGRNL